MVLYHISSLIEILLVIVPLLVAVAYFTLLERKVLSAIQKRRGPNVVGFLGIMQPLADGLKLLLKETIIPSKSNTVIFLVSPIIFFTLSFLGWTVIPFSEHSVISDIDLGILYLFAVSSLGSYGIILSGWSSNSKYAFLGALRSTAQMISYEVSIGLIVLSAISCSGSYRLIELVKAQTDVWYVIPLLPLFVIFLVSVLAETNRPPFDLPEAEAELVSGYNVEYSAMGFALFFLGECASIILMSSFIVVLFFGGWKTPFIFSMENMSFFVFATKVVFFCYVFVWIRATYPRYRYDQLMRLGWKVFLPISIGFFVFVVSLLISIDALFSIY